MTHVFSLPVLLVLVAVIGLAVVGLIAFSRKKPVVPAETDAAEIQRIQERLASSRIARRASGSRRKVVAIRPPVEDEPVRTTDTEKLPVAGSAEPPAEDAAAGH